MHGTWAAFGGLIVGPIFQCKFVTPKNYSSKEFKEVLIICLATALLFIPVQILSLCICLIIFMYFNQHSIALIPFYIVRISFDALVEKVCFLGKAPSLRIIFININALVNRLLLCWALASEINLYAIMMTVVVDFLIVFGFVYIISGPLHIHTGKNQMRTFYKWLLGYEDDGGKELTKKQRQYAVCERAKWVYFTVLHSTGEIIMPFWQMYFYYLISSTLTNGAFSGFAKAANGFPLTNSNNLLITSSIMAFFDILDFGLFTYIIRRKFKYFTPFRLLNVLIKKYSMLLALSVMSAVISVQCVLIIDCRFDFSSEGIFEAFGIRIP